MVNDLLDEFKKRSRMGNETKNLVFWMKMQHAASLL